MEFLKHYKMIVLQFFIIIFVFFVFFGLLKSGFDYIEYIHKVEQQKIDDKQYDKEKKTIERAARKTARFLMSDGSVDIDAARAYLIHRERDERRKIENIDFEIIN
jgi:hypothetical protein